MVKFCTDIRSFKCCQADCAGNWLTVYWITWDNWGETMEVEQCSWRGSTFLPEQLTHREKKCGKEDKQVERQGVQRWAPTEEVRGGKMSRMTNMFSAAEGNISEHRYSITQAKRNYRTIKQQIDLQYMFVFFLKSTQELFVECKIIHPATINQHEEITWPHLNCQERKENWTTPDLWD